MPQKKILRYTVYIFIVLNVFFISSLISYHVMLKGEKVTVPDLIGKTMEEAREELKGKKIDIIQIGVRLDETYEQGKIVALDPPAGEKLKLNEVVKAVISAGKEKFPVPRLIGINLQNINTLLIDSGFNKGKIAHVHTKKYSAGKVLAQYPLPDDQVGKGTRISLLISQGEREKKFLMPDLLGKKSSRVIARLREMGFRIGDIHRSYYPGIESGIIIKQTPSQGRSILKRNQISLEVSK